MPPLQLIINKTKYEKVKPILQFIVILIFIFILIFLLIFLNISPLLKLKIYELIIMSAVMLIMIFGLLYTIYLPNFGLLQKIKNLNITKVKWALGKKGLEKRKYNEENRVEDKITIPYEDIKEISLDPMKTSIDILLKEDSKTVKKLEGRVLFEINNIEKIDKARKFTKKLKEIIQNDNQNT